jgi:S-formylglutathione hydrolase FrmB
VVESRPGYVKVAEAPGGPPVVFRGTAGPSAKLIHDHHKAYWALYSPVGAGPGKGAVDLVGCRTVRVSGCRLSARGDTMHIQYSRDVVFAHNHITGSRMGAFFLAEFCKTATVTGNTVDGTNGSRVVSVEKSCEDVTLVGNTFRGGGRGSWINQPRNFVLADNVFTNNTTKGERDPRTGRRSHVTGDYFPWAELYFTTHEPGGRYGNVIIRGNVFTSGPAAKAAVTFEPGGDGIVVTGNVFAGPARAILPPPGAKDVTIRDNIGAAVTGAELRIPPRSFYSPALGREVAYSAFVPSGPVPTGGWPLVLVLHGDGRDHRTVADNPALGADAAKRRAVLVFADGGRGWYLDSPTDPKSRYQSMLRELLTEARKTLPVSPAPERTAVCGWSMGGYGAVRFAQAFPGEVGAVATTLGLLDFPNPGLPAEQNYPVPALFGRDEAARAKASCTADPEPLRGKAILVIAAKGAFDARMNRNFRDRLAAAGVPHEFHEVDGGHDFPTVRATLPQIWDFLDARFARPDAPR